MLLHVGPHYMQPYRKLLQCDEIFDIFEQLLPFLHCLHMYAVLQGLVYDSFSGKKNGVRL
jgi:hypothetical protein